MELLCFEKETEPFSIADPVFLEDNRVLSNLLFLETKYSLTKCYFKNVQKELTPSMRKEVSIWLLEVCMEEQCDEEVFPTAMNIMDRFLSLVQIRKSQFQLLATTCLLLSSKVVQNRTLSTDRLVMFTDYSFSNEEIRSWEILVLGELGWDICCVVPNNFLELILRRLNYLNPNQRSMVQKHAELFISLCASDYRFFDCLPSVIASACIALVLDINCFKENLFEILLSIQQVTNINAEVVDTTIELIEEIIPADGFFGIHNQIQRKRINQSNKKCKLINLNSSDMESENDLDTDIKNNSKQLNNIDNHYVDLKKAKPIFESSQAVAINYDSSNQNNSKINTNLINNLNSNLTNNLNNCSSFNTPINEQEKIQELKNNLNENEIVLIDLTCFETPNSLTCNSNFEPIHCKNQSIDNNCFCLNYIPNRPNDVQNVLY